MVLFGIKNKIGALLAFIIAAFVYKMYPSISPPANEGLIIPRQTKTSLAPWKICTKPGLIALSFNGGIDVINTLKVLDILRIQKITATFFLSSEWAGTSVLIDTVFKKVHDMGHTVGFQWWGPDPRTLTDAQVQEKLTEQATKIKGAIGKMPLFFRFPYGQNNDRVNAIVDSLGFIQVGVDIDSMDYLACNTSSGFTAEIAFSQYTNIINKYLEAGTELGSLISSHTHMCPIDTEINYIVTQIKAMYKYAFVPMEECFGIATKYMDDDGVGSSSSSISSTSKTSSTLGSSTLSSNTLGSSTLVSNTLDSSTLGLTSKSSFESYNRLVFPSWMTLPILSNFPPSTCIQDGMIAMTFDQGVSTNFTLPVLNILKANNIKATFHLSSESMGVDVVFDNLVRKIHQDGHTIGLSWFGPSPWTLDDFTLYNSLRNMSDTIYNVVGVRPRFIRIPHYTNPQPDLERKLSQLGFIHTWWSIDPQDSKSCPNQTDSSYVPSPDIVASSVDAYKSKIDALIKIANVTSSFISVHMDLCSISGALQKIVDLFKSDYPFYKFVTLEECRGVFSKYMDAPPSLIISTTSTSTSSSVSTLKSPTTTTTDTTSTTKPLGSISGTRSLFGFDSFLLRIFGTWVGIAILGTFFLF
ncbi:hypothetical protein HMI54_005961 [Coelomomyces lativittatus]|nr:hypothetical protein HMI56_005489 [Coelomomyces lativittatus]KAJ1517334.1 hypothetical protein HMI54_005961 [Coelomomyces lativittatus]KAJ1517627.1 hypothetical protein HMI55_006490 [Coelomomyces lativittatus]